MDSSEDENKLDDQNSDNDIEEIKNTNEFCGFESITEFSKNGMQQIVETTKRVNAFPSGASRDLYSAYAGFTQIVDFESSRILQIIGKILNHQQIVGNIQRRDYDEKFELLLEANDVILERVNSNLDVLAGIRKMPETILIHTELPQASLPLHKINSSWNNVKKSESPIATRTAKLITAKNIVRPQINFKISVDNSYSAFEPRLKYKPNSIKPLAVLAEYDGEGNIQSYLHPYEIELNKFEPNASQLLKVEPIQPLDVTKTPLVFVDNVVKLKEVLNDLVNVNEIAVDVEHHSYRTFQGITCLLQISTRVKDYIFDTLILRDDLHVLNEIFTNSKIVKVFHGAESDIQWLQRDLSLYIVNMFDTHQAAKRLNLARLSLAYLLKYYCKIDLDKTFQLADWRIRPLPEELIDYARKDTHYLLYIFDLMKNALIKQNNGQTIFLSSVYQQSTEICKIRYFKPQLLPQSHMDVYHKSKRVFDNRQLYAFKEIFDWRDKIARIEDESYNYVLPNHMLLQISESLPREMQGILACCNPIPPLVRQNLNALHQIVLKAREQSLVKPIAIENTNRNMVITNNKDINNPLYCPHDLSHINDFRDDMPTLINNPNVFSLDDSKITLNKPIIDIFLTPNNSDNENEEVKKNSNKLKGIKFVSPYERYKLVLPFIEQQRLDELEKVKNDKSVKLLCPAKVDSDSEQVISINDEPSSETLKKLCKRKWENPANSYDQKNDNKKKKIEKVIINNEEPLAEHGDPKEMIEGVETIDVPDKSGSDISQNTSGNKTNPKNRKQKKNKFFSNKATKQASNAAIEFDYSKVDFKKYQGGSQTSNKNDVKSKYQGKNNNNNKHNNKKFNKLFTFSNIKAKR